MTSPVPATPTVPECPGQNVALVRTVAIGLLGAGLINFAELLGFPQNAPVERLVAFGISVSLIVGAVALFLHSFVIAARPPGLSERGEKLDALTILAVIFSAMAGYGALSIGGAEQLWLFVQGARLRYLHETGGVFSSGWCGCSESHSAPSRFDAGAVASTPGLRQRRLCSAAWS